MPSLDDLKKRISSPLNQLKKLLKLWKWWQLAKLRRRAQENAEKGRPLFLEKMNNIILI